MESCKKADKQFSFTGNLTNKATEEGNSVTNKSIVSTSPKQKSKFHKFWIAGNMGSSSKLSRTGSPTDMSPPSTASASSPNYTNCASNINANIISNSFGMAGNIDVDEKQRRRAFAHYDCQSLIAKLGYDGRLKSLLSKRRNTTTGASAASMLGTRSTTPDGDNGEDDAGDGKCNDLIER